MIHEGLYGFETSYSYEKSPNGLIKISYPKDDNCYKIKYLATGPTFGVVSNALIESTFVNHITGEPFKVTSIFNKYIFENAIKEITFPDNDELKNITVSKINVNELDYNLIKIIVKSWRKETI
jgi:hypothetical protein